jgi:hypothetical protein
VREDVSTDPIDILRNHLEDCLSLDYNASFDQIVEQLVDGIKRERKEFNEHYELLERVNRDLRLGNFYCRYSISSHSSHFAVRRSDLNLYILPLF